MREKFRNNLEHVLVLYTYRTPLTCLLTGTVSSTPLTCLFRVTALGWHLVQIPPGQGAWPRHPGLILQLVSSNTANLPLEMEGKNERSLNRYLWKQIKKGVAVPLSTLPSLKFMEFHTRVYTCRMLWLPITGNANSL